MHPPAASSPAGEIAAPLFVFDGGFPPRPIPFTYRVTLALTAFAMVLLPLCYVALVGASAWGVYLWAVHGTFLFHGSGGGWVRLFLYIAPLVAGATLIAFMLKPLFARPVRRDEPFTLDLERYPQLRGLIAAVCEKVGAPMPGRVDLDCQVNASAHLRRGLLSLGRRDLVLTIGLPLAQGLTARQFAGVLAHEFGHFAQGAGMAFTFIIRSVNAWFSRVVFERDAWDASLAEWSDGGDFRIRLVAGLARGAVWLSRKVLHGLMIVGHAITCLQLRQMEYDADYYEVQLVGSEEFAATARELTRLGAAGQAAFNALGELWQTRQLVDNFPDLVGVQRSRLQPELVAKLDEHDASARTRWLDTHPSNPDRIAAARQLARPGVLRCTAPGAVLFPDLPELARTVTRHFYRGTLGLAVDESTLVSTANAQQAGEAAAASEAARNRLVGNILDLSRPLVWSEADFAPPPDFTPASLGHALRATRAEIERLRVPASHDATTYASILEHQLLVEQGHALLTAGVKINPGTFNLARSDLGDAAHERAELARRLAARAAELQPFDRAIHRWIALAGQAARAEATAATLAPAAREELRQLTHSLAALAPWFNAFPAWHRQHSVLTVFFANAKELGRDANFATAFQARFHDAVRMADEAVTIGGSAPVPLAAGSGTAAAGAVLRGALEGVEGAVRFSVALETVGKTYFRLFGRIAALAEELERQLAPPAAADPPGTPAPATGAP